MTLWNFLTIILSLSSVLLVTTAADEKSNTLNILMPDAVASHVSIRLCDMSFYIVLFK
jgi:hypothetical protein